MESGFPALKCLTTFNRLQGRRFTGPSDLQSHSAIAFHLSHELRYVVMKHTLRSRQIGGSAICESLYPAKLRQPRHTHELASFSFVLAGTYVETYGSGPLARQPSTVVFHPPQDSHAVEYGNEPVRILSVQMDSRRLTYLKERSTGFDSRVSGRSETINWLGRRLYDEFRHADDVSALALEGLVFEILAEAARTQNAVKESIPRWLTQAEEFLRDNFSLAFRFDDVARVAGVHPVHLSRVFRKKNGCTIGEYVRRLRVEFAVKQIGNTNAALGEIAIAAGFADQSHLTKTFKARLGVTPSEYRRRQRG
jgi:AraC family transcriptional regulator